MRRVIFRASGMSYDVRSAKDFVWWQNRIEERGLNYELNNDGKDVNILVDDRGDPFFRPKEKPLVSD